MTTVELLAVPTESSLADLETDAIVVGIHSGASTLELDDYATRLDDDFDGQLAETLRALGATGAVGEVTKLASLGNMRAPLLVAVGMGSRAPRRQDVEGRANLRPSTESTRASLVERIRRASGAAIRALSGCDHVVLALSTEQLFIGHGFDPEHLDADEAILAAVEGGLLASYDFTEGKSTLPSSYRAPVSHFGVVAPAASVTDALHHRISEWHIVSEAVHRARDWVNTPANLLRPADLAVAAADAARQVGLAVEVLDEAELAAGGYGGLLAVGGGSSAEPRLVRLAYRPANDHSGQTLPRIALVGKGITFDTGGISIKPAQGMGEMKTDMAGAASVIAAMLAIAELAPRADVIGYAAIAENMLSGDAYRPGDVVTLYGGHRVEILNTDAEGRIVLGDALGRASEDQPDYLFEASTLTGGAVTALGHRIAGVMGTAAARALVCAAGERVGEPMWPMPLPDDVRAGMDSDVADFAQVNTSFDRGGHMLQGGHFLAECIGEGITWAHIDIAGPSRNPGNAYGYLPKGATGMPTRTLVELVRGIGAGQEADDTAAFNAS